MLSFPTAFENNDPTWFPKVMSGSSMLFMIKPLGIWILVYMS